MTFQELLTQLRFEYWATIAANPHYQDTFYEFLLSRGFNRYQLSAHGISKDVKA